MEISGTHLRQKRQELGLSQAKLSELSGIPQHLLSSFELGKTALSDIHLATVAEALTDPSEISRLASRTKRYREHVYASVSHDNQRIQRAQRSANNATYLSVLDEMAAAHSQKEQRNFSALSLFSGCGGFSLGFSAAGFNIKGFLELDKHLRKIYKLNFPHSVELGGDITEVSQEGLAEYARVLGEVDVIIGGPPCQGFSLSGKRDVDDPRNELFKHYLRFVDVFRPKIAVLENVRLLTSMKNAEGKFVKDDITEAFRAHGYKIRLFDINARSYGVPQHRERVLFVAVRDDLGLTPSLPHPTHQETPDIFSTNEQRYRTFADACSDLEYLESGESSDDVLHKAVRHPSHVIDWLWNVPEGRSAHDNEEMSNRPPSGYNTTYKRQIWNEPASTVQTTFGMISGCRNVHPISTRSLTIREAARIQSFPDAYQFTGSLGSIRTGIGNAVPPLLAYRVAQDIFYKLSNLVEVTRF